MVTDLVTVESNGIDGRIAQANGRLKAAKVRVSIERRGGMLWLRGTFPPKPGSPQSKPYRQKISLGVKANPAGVQFAEKQARLMGAQLQVKQFDWAEWASDRPVDLGTVATWIDRLEQDFWRRHARNLKSEENWGLNYLKVLRRLPAGEPLTVEVLMSAIDATGPDTSSRKQAVSVLGKLAALAGLEVDFSGLAGNYSPRSVNPRLLPSDALIAETVRAITNPGWRWVMSLIACYGLRPHEVFHCNLNDFPILRVEHETKTGERFVYPLYPEWATAWELQNRQLPALRVLGTAGNQKLGQKVSGFVYDHELPFKAYDLRHCYARRCFEFGMTVDLGAQLMGHSPEMHKRTYRAWIDEHTYRKVFDALIYRSDRPSPPTV